MKHFWRIRLQYDKTIHIYGTKRGNEIILVGFKIFWESLCIPL
jgi:hypothetical protein